MTQNISKNFLAYYYCPTPPKSHGDFNQILILFFQKQNHPKEYFFQIQLYGNQFISHKNYVEWVNQHNCKLKNLGHSSQDLSEGLLSYYKLMILSYFGQDQK